MKIFVTGATGFTGRRVVPLLIEKGQVRCLVRQGSGTQKIAGLGCELAYGDLADIPSLKRAMEGCDTLVNIASLGFGHAAGIVRAAEEAGIKRAVFISTTALFTTINAKSRSARQEAEECIKRSALDWTILRPTMIYGAPDDRNMIRLIRFIDRFPLIPVPGSGGYLQQPVFVEDVAKAVAAVLSSGRTLRREFNLSGKCPHTYNEIIDLTMKAMGKRVLKLHVPFKLSFYIAAFCEKILPNFRIKGEQILRLNEHKAFDHSEAKEAFGFDPVSFEEGIAMEVELYRQGQKKETGK